MEAPGSWNKWLKVANMLFGYAVPLVFIMSCYAAVLWKLYSNANNSSIRDCSSQDAMLQKVTKIVIALVRISCCFYSKLIYNFIVGFGICF